MSNIDIAQRQLDACSAQFEIIATHTFKDGLVSRVDFAE